MSRRAVSSIIVVFVFAALLSPPLTTCRFQQEEADVTVVYSLTTEICVHVLAGGTNDTHLLLQSDSSNINAVAWDDDTDTIFWSDSSRRSIFSSHFPGVVDAESGQEPLINTGYLTANETLEESDFEEPVPHSTIYDDVGRVGGMAVDWVTRKLYWTDQQRGIVFVSNLDGSQSSALVELANQQILLMDVVIHPLKGWMFWGAAGVGAKIERADLDGGHRAGIYDLPRYSVPSSMTIDYDSESLFWIDCRWNRIESVSLNGTKHTIVTTSIDTALSLTAYNGWLYWIQWSQESVIRMKNQDPYDREVFLDNDSPLQALSFLHKEREKPVTHPCWRDNGGCSHLCLSGRPADGEGEVVASCACPVGSYLLEDTKNCSAFPRKYALFHRSDGLNMMVMDFAVNFLFKPLPVPLNNMLAIEIDWDRNEVYWIEATSPAIYRADLLSGEKEVAVDRGLVWPTAIALDWTGQKLYWADSGTHRIEVSYTDGSSRKVLVHGVSVDRVTSLTLDLKQQYLFWLKDSGTESTAVIYRARLDGRGFAPLKLRPKPRAVVGVTIDNYESPETVLVADKRRDQVTAYDDSGVDGRVVTEFDDLSMAVTVDDKSVYWYSNVYRGLHRAAKHGMTEPELLAKGMGWVDYFEISLKHGEGFFHSPCQNRSLCDHLCFPDRLDHRGYSCACPTGIELNSDQSSCPELPSKYILFAMNRAIGRISLDTQDLSEILLLDSDTEVCHIDYLLESTNSGRMFWSTLGGVIMSARLNGSNPEVHYSRLGSPRGIAVDWTTGNVYYADSESRIIGVVSGDGRSQNRLIESLGRPEGIAVSPGTGRMFWSDWSYGNNAVIGTACMDGSNQKTFVSGELREPSQLVVNEQHLYWVDTLRNTLERVRLDGSDRKVLTGLSTPFRLAILDGSVFWSDIATHRIFKEHKDPRFREEVYVDVGIGVPMGLAGVTTGRPGEINKTELFGPCSFRNGLCLYICAPVNATHRRCLCPDKYDGRTFAYFCKKEGPKKPPLPMNAYHYEPPANSSISPVDAIFSSGDRLLNDTNVGTGDTPSYDDPPSSDPSSGGDDFPLGHPFGDVQNDLVASPSSEDPSNDEVSSGSGIPSNSILSRSYVQELVPSAYTPIVSDTEGNEVFRGLGEVDLALVSVAILTVLVLTVCAAVLVARILYKKKNFKEPCSGNSRVVKPTSGISKGEPEVYCISPVLPRKKSSAADRHSRSSSIPMRQACTRPKSSSSEHDPELYCATSTLSRKKSPTAGSHVQRSSIPMRQTCTKPNSSSGEHKPEVYCVAPILPRKKSPAADCHSRRSAVPVHSPASSKPSSQEPGRSTPPPLPPHGANSQGAPILPPKPARLESSSPALDPCPSEPQSVPCQPPKPAELSLAPDLAKLHDALQPAQPPLPPLPLKPSRFLSLKLPATDSGTNSPDAPLASETTQLPSNAPPASKPARLPSLLPPGATNPPGSPFPAQCAANSKDVPMLPPRTSRSKSPPL